MTKDSAPVVGISALRGITSLADLAIGGNIGTTNGTTNALFGIAGPARIDPGRRAPRPSSWARSSGAVRRSAPGMAG